MISRAHVAKSVKTLIPWVNSIWNRGGERFGRELSYFRFPDCRLDSSLAIAPPKIITMARINQQDVNSPALFLGGDWKSTNVPFATYCNTNARYVSCRQVLWERKDILDTLEFEYLKNIYEKHGSARNLKSEEAIERYLLGIQEMYFTIEREGQLRSQEELSGPKFGGEVSFAISKDHELVKVDGGHHRFAAAVTLGLSVIPAQIRKIHSDCIPYIQQNHGSGAAGVRDFIRSVVANYQ